MIIELFTTEELGLNPHIIQNPEHQKCREVKRLDVRSTVIINSLKNFVTINKRGNGASVPEIVHTVQYFLKTFL